MKTPQQSYPALASALGVPEVYLKREDLHHFGSHKGRSIPVMIKKYHEDGVRDFVISSSGNAALAAILAIDAHNKNNADDPIQLTIFVGQKIDAKKLERLQSGIGDQGSGIKLFEVERPKQSALQFSREHNAVYLRQSTDDTALLGYHELAEELNHIPNLQAIFIPTSSGTTAQALGEAFESLTNKPQIHVVQTTVVHPMVDALKRDPSTPPAEAAGSARDDKRSIASAIVDKVAHRKEKVSGVVKNSGGAGWIVSDDEIRDAIQLVKKTTGIDISPNSALSVAGVRKAVAEGWKWDGAVVCLVTGT